MLEGIEAAAARGEKSVSEVTCDEVLGFAEDMSEAPTTYGGLFDKLVREAGGMEACSNDQLTDFDRQVREILTQQG